MARKYPDHSAKRAGGRLHLNMHTPLTQRSRTGLTMPAVQAWCGNLSGNELTHNSSGNTRSQSSQLAEPLSTDYGLKSGISVRELISTLKKKKRRRGMNSRTFSRKSSRARKSHHQTQMVKGFAGTPLRVDRIQSLLSRCTILFSSAITVRW